MSWVYKRNKENRTGVGDKFGRLSILAFGEKYRYFECICDCGNNISVRLDALERGDTLSCGCLQKELAAGKAKETFTTHGLSKSKVRAAWKDMKRRCYVPTFKNYAHYGARGITVCDRWLNKDGFLNFLDDMGLPRDDETLERIHVQGNYEPLNCKWEPSLSVQGLIKL